MRRGSAKTHVRRAKPAYRGKLRRSRPKSATRRRRIVRTRPAPRARVRIVRSRHMRARRSGRPLPAPEPLSERMFSGSLERSLRDFRTVWEALAKR